VTEPLLICEGVSKRFGDVQALKDADLRVAEGALLALLGPSGCGKTTMLRLIAGFETPDAGEITLRGMLIASPGRSVAPEKRRVSMVFQDFALFPHLNVAANVAFGLPKGADKASRVAELLSLVRLDGYESRMPHELSGGQQQRVALARALGPRPELLLMDEPFSNLDPAVRADVRREVRQLIRDVGITAVIVTHDQEEALSLAGEVALMMEGEVLQVGTPADIYTRPANRAVGEFLGAANFLPGDVKDGVVETPLGVVPVTASFRGAADAMVRAEDLAVSEAGGASAEVLDIDYYGHDQMITARLETGEVVRIRTLTSPVTAGQKIGVLIKGECFVFPREAR
jgi:iron(III) transport system ATP-binding protein